jgi:hypothetical protein
VIPLTIVLIGDLLEGDSEISGQGLKVFLDRIGYFVFPPLGGLLATIAWFWPFVFYLLALPLGLVALFCMPETKGKGRQRATNYLSDILSLARHPRLMIAFTAGFLRFFLDYGFLTYFPLFLVRIHGLSIALHFFRRRRHGDIEPSRAHRRRARQSEHLVPRFRRQRRVGLGGAIYSWRLADRRRFVLLWPCQRRDFAHAEKFIDAERAGGTARGHRFLGSLDSAGLENHLDLHRRPAVSERDAADNILAAGHSLIRQRRLDGLPAAAQRQSHVDIELQVVG